MKRFFTMTAPMMVILMGLAFTGSALATDKLEPITLPAPKMTGGKPLMEALAARQTIREISPEKLSMQTISNLLWAAYGVNRKNGPGGKVGRTAPSAMNYQVIDIYLILPGGVYIYDPVANKLNPVLNDDVRSKTNTQAGVASAPVQLIYVENTEKAGGKNAPKTSFAETDAGFIAENVYLFCASEGLAAWFYVGDREGFAKAIKLKKTQRVLFGQAVGRPAK